MSKDDEGLWTAPPGGKKAARILGDARRRSGLSQTELARRVGVPIQTVHRIEHGQVDPRIGTLERLLAACGRTLESEVRPTIDRSEIRELLELGPLARLRWRGEDGWGLRVSRVLGILAGQGVRFVVTGAAAVRIHGAPGPLHDLQIRVRSDHVTDGRLSRALRATNRRFVRVGLTAVSCTWPEMERLVIAARWVGVYGGRLIAVESLDDLIVAARPERAALLRCVRQEADARSA